MVFDKKHKEAIIGVVVYLAIVLALLLFLGLYKPDPPPEEEGIVMDFGGSGSGSTDPGPSKASTESATQNNTETESQPTPESNMTQSHEEAPEMPDYNTTEESEEQNNNVPEEEEEQKEEVNDNVSEIMNTDWGNTSDSDAEGDGAGEPGSGNNGEGGDGGGEGPGSGNVAGNGWSLEGRAAKSIPKPSVANCDGYVIVNIEVDRLGNVVNAYAKPGGCTACDSHCTNKAVESAKKSRFNADKNAKKTQSGTITYRFRPE